MKTTIEDITPAIAKRYLESNKDNRVVRRGWVEFLANVIREGGWILTHQGIAFDEDGVLRDGQHRLLAIIEANIGVRMAVWRGVDRRAYQAMDCMRRREVAERLHLLDDPYENRAACSISRIWGRALGSASTAETLEVIKKRFLEHASAISMVAARFSHKVRLITRSDIGAGIACYISAYPEDGAEFLEAYHSGASLDEGSPVLALRSLALSGRLGSNTYSEAYWKTIAATRYHQTGREAKRLDVASGDWIGNVYSRAKASREDRAERGWKRRRSALA